MKHTTTYQYIIFSSMTHNIEKGNKQTHTKDDKIHMCVWVHIILGSSSLVLDHDDRRVVTNKHLRFRYPLSVYSYIWQSLPIKPYNLKWSIFCSKCDSMERQIYHIGLFVCSLFINGMSFCTKEKSSRTKSRPLSTFKSRHVHFGVVMQKIYIVIDKRQVVRYILQIVMLKLKVVVD